MLPRDRTDLFWDQGYLQIPGVFTPEEADELADELDWLINTTDRMRRMVRIGYKNPENVQPSGQSCGRPGLMVRGRRHRGEEQQLFSIAGPK